MYSFTSSGFGENLFFSAYPCLDVLIYKQGVEKTFFGFFHAPLLGNTYFHAGVRRKFIFLRLPLHIFINLVNGGATQIFIGVAFASAIGHFMWPGRGKGDATPF